MIKVTVKKSGSFAAAKEALSANNPEMRRGWRQVTAIYEAFTKRRFNTFSRGGGDWTPLAKVTTDRRRRGGKAKGGVEFGGGRNLRGFNLLAKGKPRLGRGARSSIARDTRKQGILVSAGGTFSILRDKGFLFNALTIGTPGNRITEIPNGIVYGFSDAPHASDDGEFISIGQLAAAHHYGVPKHHLPARPILVYPDPATTAAIGRTLAAAAARAIRTAYQTGTR